MVKSNFNQFMKETQKEIEKLQEKQKLKAKEIILGTYNQLLDNSPARTSLYKHSHTITVNKKSPELDADYVASQKAKWGDKMPEGDVQSKIDGEVGVATNLKFKDGDNIYIQNRLIYADNVEHNAVLAPPLNYARAERYAEKLIKKAKL